MNSEWKEKITTADEAVKNIKSGDRIFVGTACATPRTLIEAVEDQAGSLSDIQLIHFLTDKSILERDGKYQTALQHKVFFVGTDTREAVKQGKADYVPISLTQVPRMIENGKIPLDVALIQVSPPDDHGYVSLGVSVDITWSAIQHAKIVIAEINPNMPRTFGNSFVSVESLDYLVMVDNPVIEYLHPAADEVSKQISRYVARIIDDGSTLQIGLGQIPNEMLKYLEDRKNLGIHSDVITDPILALIEKGVITGTEKEIHKGQIVTSYCMGSKKFYEYIDNNPMFAFYPIDYVCNPAILAGNSKLVSVTQAFAIDLTGQICADQFEGEFYSGVSTQPDFLRAAASQPGGKPIICLASTTPDQKKSRISPLLKEGEGVTIPRSDVHYVITEYGCAHLFGKSIRERALSLIEIAHPDYRSWLLAEGKRLGYLRPDLDLHSKIAYPVEEEHQVELKNGQSVLIRPSRASDFEGLQEIFYDMRPDDIYTRFFTRLKSFSASKAQHLCNVDYENEMAYVAVAGERENEEIIGSSCYFLDHSTNMADIAYMIKPQWQELGLGSHFQQIMINYAKSKGIAGFKADILSENKRMNKLAQNGPQVSSKTSFGVCEIEMVFT